MYVPFLQCEESEAEETLGDCGRPDGKRQRISEHDDHDGKNHQTSHSKEGTPSNQSNHDGPMKDEEVDNGQYHQGQGTLLSPHVKKTEKTKQVRMFCGLLRKVHFMRPTPPRSSYHRDWPMQLPRSSN